MLKKAVASEPSLAVSVCALTHDLKNDLAIIIGCCDLLRDVEVQCTTTAKHVRTIRETAKRMADRIANAPVGCR